MTLFREQVPETPGNQEIAPDPSIRNSQFGIWNGFYRRVGGAGTRLPLR